MMFDLMAVDRRDEDELILAYEKAYRDTLWETGVKKDSKRVGRDAMYGIRPELRTTIGEPANRGLVQKMGLSAIRINAEYRREHRETVKQNTNQNAAESPEEAPQSRTVRQYLESRMALQTWSKGDRLYLGDLLILSDMSGKSPEAFRVVFNHKQNSSNWLSAMGFDWKIANNSITNFVIEWTSVPVPPPATVTVELTKDIFERFQAFEKWQAEQKKEN